jgi:hypothetical protein
LQKSREADHLLGCPFDQDAKFLAASVVVKAAIYELPRLRQRHRPAGERNCHDGRIGQDVLVKGPKVIRDQTP